MLTYKITMMTKADYANYMMGGNNYCTKEAVIGAENVEKARELAKVDFPNMEILKITNKEEEELVKKVRELNHENWVKKEAERKAKQEEAKKRKIERDLENGITPSMRRAMTNARKYEREIEELKELLAEKEEKLAYWKKLANVNGRGQSDTAR